MSKVSSTLTKKLTRAGLSEKEAVIYEYLLQSGGAFPSRIAQDTSIKRTTVYKVLLDLSVKDLVNEITKRNKLFYTVTEPTKLIRYTKGNLRRAEEQVESAEGLSDQLSSLFALHSDHPKVLYFKGRDEVLNIYEDHLSQEKPYEMLSFGNLESISDFLSKKFWKKFAMTKNKKGIPTRGLVPDMKKGGTILKEIYGDVDPEIYPDVREVPEDAFLVKGEITMYGENKVSIINLKEKVWTGVIIEDDTIYTMIKTLFNLSWKCAKK